MASIYRHSADRATLEREYSPSSCVADTREFTNAYSHSAAACREHPGRTMCRYGAAAAPKFLMLSRTRCLQEAALESGLAAPSGIGP